MESSDRKPHKRKRPALLAAAMAALILLLAFLLRNCLGLGPGTGRDESPDPSTPQTVPTASHDAQPPSTRDAGALAHVCRVRLDSRGLTVDGKPASIEDAVRICSAAGEVVLTATGSARTGTYNDLVRALAQAGVEGVPPPEEL